MYRVDEEVRYADGNLATDTLVKLCLRGTSTAVQPYVSEIGFGALGGVLGQAFPSTTLKTDGQGRMRCLVDVAEPLDIVALSIAGAELGRVPLEPFTSVLEPRNYVGTAVAWGTGWGNYGGGFQTASFWRTSENIVCMEGLLFPSAGYSQTIFTLPARYRPPNIVEQAALGYMPAFGGVYAMAQLEIQTDGDIWLNNTVMAGGYVSLNGVRFEIDQ